jgi:hypothetical protein
MRTPRWMAAPVLMLLAGLVAACGQTSGATGGGAGNPPTTPPSLPAVPLTITRTGGFAGVNQTLEIAADGSWVYTDRRQNRTERGSLTSAQQLALLRLIADPGFAEQLRTKRTSGVCNDTFRYVIKAGDVSASFDDCGGQNQPAVTAVLKAVTDATPL